MLWQKLSEVVGIQQGGPLRSALDALWQQLGLDRWTETRDVRDSVAFTIAIVGLSAKLARADGVATRIEADAFHQLYHVPPSQADNIRRLFEMAQRDTAGFDAYAGQLAALLADTPDIKRDVFEGLFHVATADGVLHEAEERYLRSVASAFGYTERDYRQTKALFVRDEADPYVVLGISHDASDEEVRGQYRKLVKANHPDTLVAHGVPPEFIDQATRKMASLNEAYAEIARERGL